MLKWHLITLQLDLVNSAFWTVSQRAYFVCLQGCLHLSIPSVFLCVPFNLTPYMSLEVTVPIPWGYSDLLVSLLKTAQHFLKSYPVWADMEWQNYFWLLFLFKVWHFGILGFIWSFIVGRDTPTPTCNLIWTQDVAIVWHLLNQVSCEDASFMPYLGILHRYIFFYCNLVNFFSAYLNDMLKRKNCMNAFSPSFYACPT